MDKTFAFSYMKLLKDDGSIIPDGTHELFVYKVVVVGVQSCVCVLYYCIQAEGKKWLDPSFYMKVQSTRDVGGKLPAIKQKTSTRGKLSTISVEGSQSTRLYLI